MVTVDRWQAAQEYEQGFWQGFGEQIAEGRESQMDWYRWRAEQLAAKLREAGRPELTDGSARLIEVGCGPIGIASFFPARVAVAVDPLNDFYGSNPVLSKLRNPAVSYVNGPGEALPAETGAFDLAVIDNCIDHVRDVDAVMGELQRVLAPGGVLFLTVNCRTPLGFVVHRALSRLRIDKGHPHTFTASRARALLERHRFAPLTVRTDSYLTALRGDLAGPGLRPRIKGLLGTSEFVTTTLSTRQG